MSYSMGPKCVLYSMYPQREPVRLKKQKQKEKLFQ